MALKCLPFLAKSPGSAALLSGDVAPTSARSESDRALYILKSPFEGLAPTIFFDYPPEYGEKKQNGRVVRVSDADAPKMYFFHTNLVHPYNCVLNTLKRSGFRSSSSKWSMLWSAQPTADSLRTYHPYQKTNHFPASWHLGRKDLLWRHLAALARKGGGDIMPQTYRLPDEKDAFAQARESSRSSWIWKPVCASCGRGIRFLDPNTKVPKRPGVAQKYVSSPLLVDGYKFDMRLYVVVTGFDPLKVYLFDEGLVRLATTKYHPGQSHHGTRTMHLTNYSVNKHSSAYVKNTDQGSPVRKQKTESEDAEGSESEDEDRQPSPGPQGRGSSKWCLADLRAYYAENGWDFESVWRRIKDLVVRTLIAVEPAIVNLLSRGTTNSTGPEQFFTQNCFEIFGFDVILDSDHRPWLLEVNVSPSLSSSSPLDRRIKTMLIADVLTLVGLRPFDAKRIEVELSHERAQRLVGANRGPVPWRPNGSVSRLQSMDVQDFSAAEWILIVLTYEEFMRKGNLDLLYPRPENVAQYAKLFPAPRYRNVTLAKWLQREGDNLLRQLEETGV